MDQEQKKTNSSLFGIVSGIILFFLLGTITVLIPNSFFKRMSPVHFYDYIFLVITSLLFGIFIGLWNYRRSATKKSCGLAAGGTFGGLFSFGCAICNHLLVYLLGMTFITAYFMPVQPVLGIISIILLSWGIYGQYQEISAAKKVD